MNISFILLGITMIIGCYLLNKGLKDRHPANIGYIFMALSGLGSILVGLFPENSTTVFHVVGAGLAFIFGNAALLSFGLTMRLPVALKMYTILSGILGFVSLRLFITDMYLGLGIGGMERLVAYPQSIWMIVIGAYLIYYAAVPKKSAV